MGLAVSDMKNDMSDREEVSLKPAFGIFFLILYIIEKLNIPKHKSK